MHALGTFCTSTDARKWHVYRRKVKDLADLRQGIIEAVEFVTPHMLINKWQELEYRLDICRATKGAQGVHKNLFELLCTLLKT